ncbi:MAG: dienelactone hydrolase family protein [Balneolaceae bacterium]
MTEFFRASQKEPFKGPHQEGQTERAGVKADEALAACILIHGRGASAASILTLAEELDAPGMSFLAPEADRKTWYPYSFLEPVERNQPGLNSALQRVDDLVHELVKQGMDRDRILLAGFSQGACLISEYAARHPDRFGGLAILSGGLIGNRVERNLYSGSLEGTPVFIGCSDVDPHIPEQRVHETAALFEEMDAETLVSIYPGMAHTVNRNEIEHIQQMVDSLLRHP